MDKSVADKILIQSLEQLRTSRNFKRGRLTQITENENLYLGIAEKQIRNPYNECYPFMAGYVDHLRARIEDDSMLEFSYESEKDLKTSMKVQSMYERVSKSPAVNDSWNIKHRYAKLNAIFSGRAIYKYFSEKNPQYRSVLSVISHYDFHNEPRGGGQLERHLFCGEDNIFKTEEELESGSQYDQEQVAKLVTAYRNNQWKDNWDYEGTRNSRFYPLGQQPEANNFVGQGVIKLVDWFTTYKGERYYILFNEQSSTWVRCQPLKELIPSGLWPYVSWATNEDPDVFWSKSPADDARPVARIINNFINQELYNRQKRNYGQRAYDPDMFPNVAALADWRPDGLVPYDSKGGTRSASVGIYEFKVGDLNGTLDMVSWLENFTGKQTGNTASAQGDAPASKQATVFMGEIEQVDKLINVKNKSFYDALSELGLRFKEGLEVNLDTAQALKIMGGKGVEWVELRPEELKTEQPLTVIPVGGSSEVEIKRLRDREKAATLEKVESVNPQWKDRQMLLLAGWDSAEVKDAFSDASFTERELMSEAAIAEQMIMEGKKPELNRGATAAYMQHIIDFANDTNRGEAGQIPLDKYNELLDFATAHLDIVVQNQNREVHEMLAQRAKASLSTPREGGIPSGAMMPGYAPNGGMETEAISTSGGVSFGG